MYSQDEKDKMAMKNATIDKFASRGDGDGANRGDRMVARGERKIERGERKIERANKLIDKGAKISSKIIDRQDVANKLAKLYGGSAE
jgi:hypothetical protein